VLTGLGAGLLAGLVGIGGGVATGKGDNYTITRREYELTYFVGDVRHDLIFSPSYARPPTGATVN
jgi:hypothetical protein